MLIMHISRLYLGGFFMQLYNLSDVLYNLLDKLYKCVIIVYRKLNNKKRTAE